VANNADFLIVIGICWGNISKMSSARSVVIDL